MNRRVGLAVSLVSYNVNNPSAFLLLEENKRRYGEDTEIPALLLLAANLGLDQNSFSAPADVMRSKISSAVSNRTDVRVREWRGLGTSPDAQNLNRCSNINKIGRLSGVKKPIFLCPP